MSQKCDRKQKKMEVLKKVKGEQELRVAKLKNTLDNVKTFLKLLNSNFMKSMKQQNSNLKD